MPGVKYILVKKCINCFNVANIGSPRCSNCNDLFTIEASPEEAEKANKRLLEMQERTDVKD